MLKYIKRLIIRLRDKYLATDRLEVLVERGLVVGNNLNMMTGWIIDPSHCWHISIGDNVTFAPRVHVLAHDASTKHHLGYTRIGKVVIGDRVFVGASSTILPGVTIGNDVIVGSGSIVTRDIPAGMVAVGSPARVVCTTEEYLTKKRVEMESAPVFDSTFTMSAGVTLEMKAEMNEKMADGIGYVV